MRDKSLDFMFSAEAIAVLDGIDAKQEEESEQRAILLAQFGKGFPRTESDD